MRHEQHEAKLGQLRRLDREEGKPDPAAGTARLETDARHEDRQQQRHAEEQEEDSGFAAQAVIVELHQQRHHPQADQGEHALLLQVVEAVGELVRRHDRRG